MNHRRAPIYLSKNTMAIIDIYEKMDDCLDICLHDFTAYQGKNHEEIAIEAAQELINHIGDNCNLLFLRALRDAVTAEVERTEKQRGIK